MPRLVARKSIEIEKNHQKQRKSTEVTSREKVNRAEFNLGTCLWTTHEKSARVRRRSTLQGDNDSARTQIKIRKMCDHTLRSCRHRVPLRFFSCSSCSPSAERLSLHYLVNTVSRCRKQSAVMQTCNLQFVSCKLRLASYQHWLKYAGKALVVYRERECALTRPNCRESLIAKCQSHHYRRSFCCSRYSSSLSLSLIPSF